MAKKTTVPVEALAPEAPSVDYIRSGRWHLLDGKPAEPGPYDAERADNLATILRGLSVSPPAFFADLPPDDGAQPSDLSPADHVKGMHTDCWPRGESAGRLLRRLHSFASSEAAADLFGYYEELPSPFYTGPRLGWRPGEKSDRPDGYIRHTCELTGSAFDVPAWAPVPCLYFDTPTEGQLGDPNAMPARSEEHGAEYVDALNVTPISMVVHPALVEAGPKYVLAAVWEMLERKLFKSTEVLNDLLNLASTFAKMEPHDLTSEWPSRAYRKWAPAVHDGGEKTWERRLVGFMEPK